VRTVASLACRKTVGRWSAAAILAAAFIAPVVIAVQPASAAPVHVAAARPTSRTLFKIVIANPASPYLTPISCVALADSPSVIHGVMVGVGEIFCNEAVASITITTNMFRNGQVVGGSVDGCIDNEACASSVSYTCHSPFGYHYWYTSMTGTVVAPPGYAPHSETRGAVSATVRIYC
jgi:hypothetical protein